MSDAGDLPWRQRPYRREGSALSFPRDEGWHRLFDGPDGRRLTNPSMAEMEWVYLNAHVEERGGRGRRFVVFAAYFTQWLRFLVVRAWDREDRYLGAWTGTAFGRLHAREDRFDVAFTHDGGVDTWVGGEGFDSKLDATDDAGRFAVSLSITNTREPYECGGAGFLPFARSGWFYYWSLTRLAVTGALTLTDANGTSERVEVDGRGWFDHQWGDFRVTPFRVPGFEEYEWISVQLDSGEDLMITTVWDRHGETPSLEAFGGVGLVRGDDEWRRVIGPAYVRRTRFWRSIEQQAVYAAQWRVRVAAWDLDLTITPRHDDQLTPIFDDTAKGLGRAALRGLFGPALNLLGAFWEGSCRVEGTFEGRPVKGFAFAELVKRYPSPKVTLRVAREEIGFTVLAWRVEGWDPECPLRYRVMVESPDGRVLWVKAGLDVAVCVLDDPKIPRGADLVVRVVAASDDGVVRGETTEAIVLR